MPGGTHKVGAKYFPSVEQLIDFVISNLFDSLSDRPFSTRVVLRLHRR